MTLVEAVVLVFLVMLLFLQNIRYTIIPTIVVPVALLGTCAMLLLPGFSINMLTLFGMVLAIGILVDDAIVVVENVERIMSEEGLSPKEATRKAMSQITGAIIGITLVLMAVFVPMAFFPGSVGIIYQQFSVTMVAAIGFSALLALSLTPALCATLLKPVEAGHDHARRACSAGSTARSMERARTAMPACVQLVAAAHRPAHAGLRRAAGRRSAGRFVRLPGGFLPVDDQGFITTDVQTPPEASFHAHARSRGRGGRGISGQAAGRRDRHVPHRLQLSRPGHEHRAGLRHAEGLVGAGPKDSAAAIVADINRELSSFRDAKISALQPPPIDNLGNSAGFSFRLQDRGQRGYAELMRAEGPADRGSQCEARCCRTSMSKACRPRRRSS